MKIHVAASALLATEHHTCWEHVPGFKWLSTRSDVSPGITHEKDQDSSSSNLPSLYGGCLIFHPEELQRSLSSLTVRSTFVYPR